MRSRGPSRLLCCNRDLLWPHLRPLWRPRLQPIRSLKRQCRPQRRLEPYRCRRPPLQSALFRWRHHRPHPRLRPPRFALVSAQSPPLHLPFGRPGLLPFRPVAIPVRGRCRMGLRWRRLRRVKGRRLRLAIPIRLSRLRRSFQLRRGHPYPAHRCRLRLSLCRPILNLTV